MKKKVRVRFKECLAFADGNAYIPWTPYNDKEYSLEIALALGYIKRGLAVISPDEELEQADLEAPEVATKPRGRRRVGSSKSNSSNSKTDK